MHGYGVACFTAKCRRRAAAPRAPLAFYILDVYPLQAIPRLPSRLPSLSPSSLSLSLSLSLSALSLFLSLLPRYPPKPFIVPRSLVALSSQPPTLAPSPPPPWYHFVCLSRGGPSRRRRARCLTRVSFSTIHPRPAPPARVRAYIDRPCTRTPFPLPLPLPLVRPRSRCTPRCVSASLASPRACRCSCEVLRSRDDGIRPDYVPCVFRESRLAAS